MAGSECRRGGLVSCAEPRTGRFGLLLHTFCLRAYEALGTGCGSEQNPEIPAPWSFLGQLTYPFLGHAHRYSCVWAASAGS